jgi:hypothetical protein
MLEKDSKKRFDINDVDDEIIKANLKSKNFFEGIFHF